MDMAQRFGCDLVGVISDGEELSVTAVASKARRWMTYVKDADLFPNLKWLPSRAAEPRCEHRLLWNSILLVMQDREDNRKPLQCRKRLLPMSGSRKGVMEHAYLHEAGRGQEERTG